MGSENFDFLLGDHSPRFTDPMNDQVSRMNELRKRGGLPRLVPTSGIRSSEQNVLEMMKNVRAGGSLKQARESGYTRAAYQPSLKSYFADPSPENLKRIGEVRRAREKTITGGHKGGDAMDVRVTDLSDRTKAIARVAWLESQGYTTNLENWSEGSPRGKNAHIHLEGVLQKLKRAAK